MFTVLDSQRYSSTRGFLQDADINHAGCRYALKIVLNVCNVDLYLSESVVDVSGLFNGARDL